jgi:hypothetical protein
VVAGDITTQLRQGRQAMAMSSLCILSLSMFFTKKEHGLDKILAHLNNIIGSPYFHISNKIAFGDHQNTLAFNLQLMINPCKRI